MHFWPYNYDWRAVIAACGAGCHVTARHQRAHGKWTTSREADVNVSEDTANASVERVEEGKDA